MIPIGESLSDILAGLERDILRILTRTLITEPLAEGIRGGLAGDKTGAGGLEGLFNKVFGGFGGLINLGDDAADSGTSEAAKETTSALIGLGAAGGAAGGLLGGTLSEGALKAGIETLTQASASTFATTQLTELAVAAGAAAAALQTIVAGSAVSAGGGGPDELAQAFGFFDGFGGSGGGFEGLLGSLFGGGGATAGGQFGAGGAGAFSGGGPGQFASASGPFSGGGGAGGGTGLASAGPYGAVALAAILTAFGIYKSLPTLEMGFSKLGSRLGKTLSFGLFHGGGSVSGPGTSISDSIPALLSDGEFVVNAGMARRHRRLLEMINAGITPPAFAAGGRAAPFMRFAGADFAPSRPMTASPEPRRDASIAERPIIVHINNPTSVPEIQRNMAQIRGSLRQMLARAERRGE